MAAGRWSAGLVGLAVGFAGGAAGLQVWEDRAEAETRETASAWIEIRRMPLPLATAEGTLVRYAAVDLALEVSDVDRTEARRRIPNVRHALNMRAHDAPLALDASGRIDIEALRTLAEDAAAEASPDGMVRGVRILAAQQI